MPTAAKVTVQLATGIGIESRRIRDSGMKPWPSQPAKAMMVTPVGISTGINIDLASTMVMATRPEIAISTTMNAGHDH